MKNESKSDSQTTMACRCCLIKKPIDQFRKYKKKIKDKEHEFILKSCRPCENKQRKERTKKNPEKTKEMYKRYYEKNKSNPLFYLKKIARNHVYAALKKKSKTKRQKTEEYIGCTIEFLKEHIEKQFKDQMTWENYGSYWHIDHIIPLGLATTESELMQLLHYTNLQPLEASANILKAMKLDY
jgi:hypothetical protein